jgi:pimeloyl-ACP methyl ester carboxylesterase
MRPRLKVLSVLGRGGFRRLAYAEWGPARASRNVVCVHGVSRTGRDFDLLAAAMAREGARVIVPDLPGHGCSQWLASPTHYTDRAYTHAMSTLLARLDVEDVDWLGTSLGGHLGMLIAAEDATPVRRLVLNDFGARVSAGALRRIGGYLGRRWRFASMELLEGHLRQVHAPFGALSDSQWRHLAEHSAVADAAGGYRFHFDPAIGARFAIPIWLDIVLWQIWDRIDCPVLILRGQESDLLSRRTVADMLARGPAAARGQVTAVEFPGCGHAPALMDPDQIRVVRDFLLRPSSDPSGADSKTEARPRRNVPRQADSRRNGA